MLLAVCISSYGCTWEVWRALKKIEFLSATPRANLTLLECSPNFPGASTARYTTGTPSSMSDIDRGLCMSVVI